MHLRVPGAVAHWGCVSGVCICEFVNAYLPKFCIRRLPSSTLTRQVPHCSPQLYTNISNNLDTYLVLFLFSHISFHLSHTHLTLVRTVTGEITSRLTNDAATVGDLLALNCNIFLRSLLKTCNFSHYSYHSIWAPSIVYLKHAYTVLVLRGVILSLHVFHTCLQVVSSFSW